MATYSDALIALVDWIISSDRKGIKVCFTRSIIPNSGGLVTESYALDHFFSSYVRKIKNPALLNTNLYLDEATLTHDLQELLSSHYGNLVATYSNRIITLRYDPKAHGPSDLEKDYQEELDEHMVEIDSDSDSNDDDSF